jgi:programmed cell death 8 (apoptosis-inducing factor)
LAEDEEIPVEELPQKFDFVFVGGGMASYMAIKEIKSKMKDPSILLIGDELYSPYLRPPLSKNLWKASEEDKKELSFQTQDGEVMNIWADGKGNNPIEGVTQKVGHVRSIDSQKKVVILEDGSEFQFEKCLLATGARAISLRHIEDKVRDKVHTLRTIDQWKALEAQTKSADTTVTIVGGGYLGTELASSIQGCKVVQVLSKEHPMNGVFPNFLGERIGEKLNDAGVELVANSHVVAVTEKDEKCNIIFEDGSSRESDVVVLALGVEADFNVIARSGFEVDTERGGVVANSELQVVSDVYAAGDVVSYYDVNVGMRRRVEHVDHASMSGILAAQNMMGAKKVYDYLPVEFGSMAGIEWEGCGLLDADLDTISIFDEAEKKYEKGVVYYLEEGQVVGCLTINLPDKMDYCKKMVKFGLPIEDPKDAFNLIYLGQ